MMIMCGRMAGKWAFARWVSIAALSAVLPACGGGGGGDGGEGSLGGSGGNGATASSGTATSLSCDGYPNSQQTYTQACLIVQEYAQVTPDISVSTNTGMLIAHGRESLDAYVVYARIIAQAADVGSATALAKSVVITAANGTVSASPGQVASPQALQIDLEIFTAPSTSLTLTTVTGNVTADTYNSTFQLNSQVGNASLQNVQGQVTVAVGTGSIEATLTGTGWTGAGMTASTQSGNISVTRPAGYQAAFTAQANLGIASIDSQQALSNGQNPAVVTAGSGAPIVLKSVAGNVAVGANQ
jgi:hypothetical protein